MFKFSVLLALLVASSGSVPIRNLKIPLDIIDMAAISRMSPGELELLAEGLAAEEMIRTKRSSEVLSQITSKVTSGISSKVGLLGQASAGVISLASQASSGSSSKSGDEHQGYSYHEPEDKDVTFWGLKKSILNTLFQAVKAITGGVTILKGQLIKGSGAFASVAAKVISAKGDTVTNLGRKIVNSAQLSPTKPHHSSPPVYGPPPVSVEYGAPHHSYGAPTGFAAQHIPYEHSGPSFTSPGKYSSSYEGQQKGPLSGLHAGLILIKPLDGPSDDHTAPSGHGTSHLEPPPGFISTAYNKLKSAISNITPFVNKQTSSNGGEHPSYDTHAPGEYAAYDTIGELNASNQPPPPPQEAPSAHDAPPGYQHPNYHGALNSYGEPAAPELQYGHHQPTSYAKNAIPPFDHVADFASTKYSALPASVYHMSKNKYKRHNKRFTPSRLAKINANIEKLNNNLKNINMKRSSEEVPLFDSIDLYSMLTKKKTSNVNYFNVIGSRAGDVDIQSVDETSVRSLTTVVPEETTVAINTTKLTEVTKPTKDNNDVITKENKNKKVILLLKGNKIVPVVTNE